ncbi:MAG: hypothetical protein QG656_1275 [Candidatus Hydrogenedentes bacterium]|nr:hypothetical protein [Candidatus Hydrogenedentota bacterium]
MTHQLLWIVVASLTSWSAPVIPLESAVASQAPVAEPAAGAPTDRVWIERGTAEEGRRVWIEVEFSPEQLASEPIWFDCTFNRYGNSDKIHAWLTVSAEDAEQPLFQGDLPLSLREEQNECKFVWDASAAPTGVYTARIEWRDRPEYLLGSSDFVIRKVSAAELGASLEMARAAVADLRGRLDDLAAEGKRPPYLWMRTAIAEDFLALAADDLAQDRCRRVDAILRYLHEMSPSVRAQLTFGSLVPELNDPIPEPDLGAIEVQNGVFYAGGQPAFLLGWGGWLDVADEIPRLAEYGLNLVTVEIAPRDTLTSETETADIPALIGPLFQRAEENNVSVIVDLSPDDLPQWALDKWPDMKSERLDGVDVSHPQARALLERHYRALLPHLAGRKMLNSVCILDNPRFCFEGEAVKKGFLERVKQIYPDRHALNRSWKSHLADFENIDITREHKPYEYQEKTAYQYDWQTYHQEIGVAFIKEAMDLARGLAPGVPLFVKSPNTVFSLGESRTGVDREALAALTDFNGCMATVSPFDKFYSMEYPRHSLNYAFLRSLAPWKPVVNCEDCIVSGGESPGFYTAEYVHSVIWDAAISGMSASAVWGWNDAGRLANPEDSVLARPLCLEGYARAAMDLNRLGRVVAAFQQAPADVAILWSPPAKILQDGVPYLSSAHDAYEGSSFAGVKLRYITQRQCAETQLEGIKVLIIPETPSLSDEGFAALQKYIEGGGIVARIGTPIPYNERGHSRHDTVGNTPETILVRGVNLPTEYLHAMDAVFNFKRLADVPRVVNSFGYPLEGVKTRYVEVDGEGYLYVLNLRKETALCRLLGPRQTGRDLILGRDISFPFQAPPLEPMLVRLDPSETAPEAPQETPPAPEGPPVVTLQPATSETPAEQVQ